MCPCCCGSNGVGPQLAPYGPPWGWAGPWQGHVGPWSAGPWSGPRTRREGLEEAKRDLEERLAALSEELERESGGR